MESKIIYEIVQLEKKYPNDFELGKAIRKYLNQLYESTNYSGSGITDFKIDRKS